MNALANKPIIGLRRTVLEPLCVDLVQDPNAPVTPIHLGIRTVVNHLREYLRNRRQIGVNHIALNLRFNQADIEPTLDTITNHLIGEFSL